MANRIKLTIINAEVNSYAASANGTITYLAEMQPGNDGASDNPQVMIEAMNLVPRIGSTENFGSVPGAPNPQNQAASFTTVSGFITHQLRVSRVRPYIGNTNSGKAVFVEVSYESRPRPTIEIGSTAVQERTDTFLSQVATNAGNFYLKRQQMTLDWLVKKGTYSIPGSTQLEPPSDVPLPLTTVQGSRFRLGSTIRVSSTYYNDEINLSQAIALAGLYTTTVNKEALFYNPNYLNGQNLSDQSSWLTTAVGAISMDGGYTIKVFGEFMFNPYGWDTHVVYTEPFTQQLAILQEDVVKQLWARSTAQTGTVPEAYNPPQAGAGRFPQQVQYYLSPLVGFLSQGLIGKQAPIGSIIVPQF